MFGIQYSKHEHSKQHAVCDACQTVPEVPKFRALKIGEFPEREDCYGMGVNREERLDRILQEKFTSVFRKGYVKVKGVTMPERFLDLKDDIHNWDVNDTDIWVCSFPKTGTTWTQEMVWLIANNLDYEGAKVNLGQRFPFLEVSALFDYRQLMADDKEFKPPDFLTDSLTFVRNQPNVKFIKTHLPWQLLPKQIQYGSKYPKIIYVARNPKDTCISYYHHSKLLEGYRGTFDEFCDLFLAGKLNFAPYWDHVIDFWKRRKESNIMFIKYEDMKDNLSQTVREVSEFLEKKLPERDIETLCDHLSFESMRRNDSVNYEMVVELNKKFKLIEHDGVFMRSGTVGSYKAIMSPELVKRFDRWTEDETLKGDIHFYNNF